MAKMNKHQQNSMKALIKKLEILGEVEAARLAQAVMDNNHNAMLDNKVYWSRHE